MILAMDHKAASRGSVDRCCAVLLAGVLLAAGCASSGSITVSAGADPSATTATPGIRPVLDWGPAPDRVDGLVRLAFTEGDEFVLQTSGGDRRFIPGINLGSTIPGHAPGELAVSAQDYRRWFPLMTEMGFRAVRVYTILPPVFYEELAAYNDAHSNAPLYLLQGVWVPEEAYYEKRDLFDLTVRAGFLAELSDAVAVVHGDADLPERPGHASGSYRTDVSEWLIGWLIGVEWDPEIVFESDQRNSDRAEFDGAFFRSEAGASPTEVWLAEMLDHLASMQAARGRAVPLGFSNWPTTDPLSHPDEPDQWLRLVAVDANNVSPTSAWPGGYFASYHVYPYYPDFLSLEPGLVEFEYQGGFDPYAGYLIALRDHHAGLPVLIAEFGVPSGMALARTEPLGRDQGNHREHDQMAINAAMLETIHDLKLAGAYVFEWIDEWFKLTWNTMDYEQPADRRAMWQNQWTNESHFGLLAADPGTSTVVIVDGDDGEWATNDSQVIFEDSDGLREVRAVKDEAFLYLLLRFDEEGLWEREPISIGFDVLSDGGGGLPGSGLDPDADYAVTLGPGRDGRIEVRSDNDLYTIRYGFVRKFFDVDEQEIVTGSGEWYLHRLLVRRPIEVPTTGETYPVATFDAGTLRFGTADPQDPEFDSRTTWSAAGGVIEIRLPYMAIGFSDPSSLQAYRITSRGQVETETVSRVGITVILDNESRVTNGFGWEPWQSVNWHERPKAGLDQLTDVIWSIVESS
jgi:hypothetical protein